MRLRVYVVEDSPLVFERLQESMEENGASVVGHADDATTAIAEIAALRPDAVVVDIALREGTGLHVLKEIGEFPEERSSRSCRPDQLQSRVVSRRCDAPRR